MKCNICCGKAIENTDFCRNCLVRAVERRARKRLSKIGITGDCRVLVVNDDSCEGQVNAFLIKKLVTATKNIKHAKNLGKNSRYDFVSFADTADMAAERFLGLMLDSSLKRCQKHAIKLLRGSLSKEVAAYAKIKRIKYAKKNKLSDIALLLERLERYKGTKFALAKLSERVK
ncbi:hypothetical protein J4470_01155 [Candidatus Woesearchaeota archaeon]|nr:hypothetical protein [Candidatus Woesearchaeota archaeon]